MVFEYYYCGSCKICYLEDYFAKCDTCKSMFEAPCCGYICEWCIVKFEDQVIKNKSVIIKEGRIYCSEKCENEFDNNSEDDGDITIL